MTETEVLRALGKGYYIWRMDDEYRLGIGIRSFSRGRRIAIRVARSAIKKVGLSPKDVCYGTVWHAGS